MVFAYYKRLSRAQQRVYQKSDEMRSIALPDGMSIEPVIHGLTEALKREDRRATEVACQQLALVLTGNLGIRPVQVQVLAVRPSRTWGELHGLYRSVRGRGVPRITVWMRTAQRHQVVAFRTFLRTLVHEMCHHFDYELLRLPESFHTEGFYKRESSVMHQLVDAKRDLPKRAP
ncbi:MAG: hypothetical protein HY695_36495 [Deltaproteobacteria bacterium]|nr:hypothetical protein [Deltaproteobacteria bacterium]